jgi:hypothetical protein
MRHTFPFADLALARRIERAEGHANAAFVQARAAIDPACGATFLEVGGTYWASSRRRRRRCCTRSRRSSARAAPP